MTLLVNYVVVAATPARVWEALTTLDALHEYDPGVTRASMLAGPRSDVGAGRQCDLRGGGWRRERVTEWEPRRVLAFELVECTLPVRRLRHRYALTPDRDATRVEQQMSYELKCGPLGALLDTLVVRRKWDAGIKMFFAGLKAHVERSNATTGGPGSLARTPT